LGLLQISKRHTLGPIRRSRGFTLIELLIVISIILVILAIAVPKMNTQMQGTREMAVIREIGSIHQADAVLFPVREVRD
jgi:prepilin-type N-terminal cleavage/methylation domain-containing protein